MGIGGISFTFLLGVGGSDFAGLFGVFTGVVWGFSSGAGVGASSCPPSAFSPSPTIQKTLCKSLFSAIKPVFYFAKTSCS